MNTENILEIDKIKETLCNLSLTDKAKERFQMLTPMLSEIEVKAALRDTTEAKRMIEELGNPPVAAMTGINEMVQTAKKGGCLLPEQFEQISYALTSVRRLKDYLNRAKLYELSLAYYDENFFPLEELREQLNQMIRNGQVDDYASKTLRSVRNSIETAENKMKTKADEVFRKNKKDMSDHFTTVRNGRICLPVKSECKFKVPGSVIDKSATGNTLFIEPVSVAKIYEEIQILKIEEENEVRRILYELSGMVADEEEAMSENERMMEKLDFIFAKAKWSLDVDGCEPVMSTERCIKIEKGRHPLMDKKVAVPLDFQFDDGIRGVIITGPNTGGKTVAIKTVAINCYLAQCGLHVCCESAKLCMNNMILCDIGDGQNLSENLSTFSSHITNVLSILKKAGPESLVIMDELGSGTDPAEGMGIAVAILEELKKSGALFLVTTHYPEVKEYARKEQSVVNARMTFDKNTLCPLYQLVIGEAGESCAFYIAKKLGMPDSMLRRAEIAAYGKSNISCDKSHGIMHEKTPKIIRHVANKKKAVIPEFTRGDSVMVYPDEKIGIVCVPPDKNGELVVQIHNQKITLNHKRVKLHVKASELYPEDYDFSIVFDSVETRKKRHQMERKYIPGQELEE